MRNKTEKQMDEMIAERVQRIKLLNEAGWRHASSSEEYQELYDLFVEKRGFSIHSDSLIDLPEQSAAYDFRLFDCLSKTNQKEVEYRFRKTVFDFFRNHYAQQACVVLDVNHESFCFEPCNLKLDDCNSPSPFSFCPPWEYVNVSDLDFTNGVLTDWKNMKLIVYGNEMVEALLGGLPVLPCLVNQQRS